MFSFMLNLVDVHACYYLFFLLLLLLPLLQATTPLAIEATTPILPHSTPNQLGDVNALSPLTARLSVIDTSVAAVASPHRRPGQVGDETSPVGAVRICS